MSIAAVRSGVATLAGAVAGVREALPYPPTKVGPLPLAWLGDAEAEVTMGEAESWRWRLPLNLIVAQGIGHGPGVAAAEPILDGIMAAVRADFTLGGIVSGLNVVSVREGQLQVGEAPYPGLTIIFDVRYRRGVTLR